MEVLGEVGKYLLGLAGLITAIISMRKVRSTRHALENGHSKRLEVAIGQIGDLQAAFDRYVQQSERTRYEDLRDWRRDFDRMERRVRALE